MTVRLTNPSDSHIHFILSPIEPCGIYHIEEVGDEFYVESGKDMVQVRLRPHESTQVKVDFYFFFSTAFIEFCGVWYNIFRDQKSSVSRELCILPRYYKQILV